MDSPREHATEVEALKAKIEHLLASFEETQNVVQAIRDGEVDAVVVRPPEQDPAVYTFFGEDHPYRALVEAMTEGAVTLEKDGTILYCNPSFARMMHAESDDIIGSSFEQFVQPADAARLAAFLDQEGSDKAEMTLFAHDGTRIPAYLSRSAADLVGIRGICLVVTDLTHQKQHERKIQDLALRLTMAEQEERQRISQILHDDLQQLLYGIGMKLGMIRQGLQKVGSPEQMAGLAEVGAWVERAVTTTRRLTVDMSPPILKKRGLTEIIDWLRMQIQELHGLAVTVEAAHPFVVADEDLRVLLFQIVRELLFNVKKHAGVDRATVRLNDTAGQLVISVIDDGRGFDVEAVTAREEHDGGFGLFSVRERLYLVGGRLEIQSQPGDGTHINVYAPVQPE